MRKEAQASSESRRSETALDQHLRRYRKLGWFPLGFVSYRPRQGEVPTVLVSTCGKALVGRAHVPGTPLMNDREIWPSLGNQLIDCMREGWRYLGLIVVDREERVRLNLDPQAAVTYLDFLERARLPVMPHQVDAWRVRLLAQASREICARVLERLRVFAKDVDAYLEERMEGEAAAPSILGPWPRPEGLGALRDAPLDKLMDAPAEAFPLAVRWSWRRTQ